MQVIERSSQSSGSSTPPQLYLMRLLLLAIADTVHLVHSCAGILAMVFDRKPRCRFPTLLLYRATSHSFDNDIDAVERLIPIQVYAHHHCVDLHQQALQRFPSVLDAFFLLGLPLGLELHTRERFW